MRVVAARIRVDLVEGPIRVEDVSADLEDAAAGGVTLFLGRVRNHHEGHAVHSVHYHVYREMAVPAMQAIAEETLAKFPVTRLVILHRVGHLAIGDVSVLVAAAGEHRDEAFRACRHGIDRIKEDVPIWKKEVLADGTEEWVDARCAHG